MYERLYGPLGGVRDDYLAAMISSTVASSFSEKPPPFSDFMPSWPQIMGGDDGDDT